MKSWPPTIPELQMVTVRCWWVGGKVDKDEEPAKPFLFCLEVPTILLQYVTRQGRAADRLSGNIL
jgi:hypothetical protein